MCLDWTGSWQTHSGQEEVFRERTKGENKAGEEGQRDEEEEAELLGYHESPGGIKDSSHMTHT